MQDVLITTKLRRPSLRPGLVPRPDLVARLDQALDQGQSLILISAPAGYGKTTIVLQWLEAVQVPVAWLSLDESDDDPATFWTYVIATLRSVYPAIGEAAQSAMRGDPGLETGRVVAHLINRIDRADCPCVLVLDDYHLIQDARIHRLVGFLLEHMPTGLTLVLLTRRDPPIALARLRASWTNLELRQRDLRFQVDEAKGFLEGTMALSLPSAQSMALWQRTEGWPAGMQLAALSLRGLAPEERPEHIAAYGGHTPYLVRYLMDEVLERLRPEERSFLLRTAFLERLTGPLCEAVCGLESSRGQAMLERLEQANVFLAPVGPGRRWFRYHRLFAEALQHRLAEAGTDEERALHLRASAWHESQGALRGAIEHAFSAHAHDLAARLIERASLDLNWVGQLLLSHAMPCHQPYSQPPSANPQIQDQWAHKRA